MEHTNHPFGKENDLNQTPMIMFPVNLPGCKFSLAKEIARHASNERENAKSTSGTASASRVGAEVLR